MTCAVDWAGCSIKLSYVNADADSANDNEHSQELWTENGRGSKVSICEVSSGFDEAYCVIDTLRSLGGSEEEVACHLSESAILYRTGAQSRVIEQVLVAEKVRAFNEDIFNLTLYLFCSSLSLLVFALLPPPLIS